MSSKAKDVIPTASPPAPIERKGLKVLVTLEARAVVKAGGSLDALRADLMAAVEQGTEPLVLKPLAKPIPTPPDSRPQVARSRNQELTPRAKALGFNQRKSA